MCNGVLYRVCVTQNGTATLRCLLCRVECTGVHRVVYWHGTLIHRTGIRLLVRCAFPVRYRDTASYVFFCSFLCDCWSVMHFLYARSTIPLGVPISIPTPIVYIPIWVGIVSIPIHGIPILTDVSSPVAIPIFIPIPIPISISIPLLLDGSHCHWPNFAWVTIPLQGKICRTPTR